MTSTERAKDKRLKSTYNSSLAAHNETLAEQGGKCAICSRPFPPLVNEDGKSFTANQDHFHGCCPRRVKQFCGRCNRGLLCLPCNKFVVGVIERLKIPADKLAGYMEKWKKILRERGCYDNPTVKPEIKRTAKKRAKKAKKIRRA